jgi:ABC-2 type transport system permease protein
VKEKERGTMEQILVSPIKPYELIIGKTATYIIIALITALLIFIAGYYLFGVVIKGSYFLLFVGIIVYLAASLGIGLLISSISDTQQVAFMISAIATMLPTFVLSGFVFPISNMPIVVQWITYIVPARYFFVILREVILKGSGISAFWKDLLLLTIYAVLTLVLSTLRMRKRTL